MENFIQIAIFLFIIYALFGSILGKKKKAESENNIPESLEGEDQQKSSPSSSPEDLLEMFGFKIPKTGGEQVPEQTNLPAQQKMTRIEIEKSNVSTSKLTASTIAEDEKKEKDFKEQSKVYDTPRSINERANSIKETIKNSSSLRDLILISEILKKPKAYRS